MDCISAKPHNRNELGINCEEASRAEAQANEDSTEGNYAAEADEICRTAQGSLSVQVLCKNEGHWTLRNVGLQARPSD